MRADPEPYETLLAFLRQSTVPKTDTSRPKVTNFLEMNRGVARIGFEQSKVLVRQLSLVIG